MTAAEVMVSITCLEFSYTQAPPKLKSFLMAINLLSVFVGNQFVSRVNAYFQTPTGESTLEGAEYYWFFCGAMLITAVAFILFAMTFKERTYIQQEQPA
jgi:POT family proton-dependent oligopeptide transporter